MERRLKACGWHTSAGGKPGDSGDALLLQAVWRGNGGALPPEGPLCRHKIGFLCGRPRRMERGRCKARGIRKLKWNTPMVDSAICRLRILSPYRAARRPKFLARPCIRCWRQSAWTVSPVRGRVLGDDICACIDTLCRLTPEIRPFSSPKRSCTYNLYYKCTVSCKLRDRSITAHSHCDRDREPSLHLLLQPSRPSP